MNIKRIKQNFLEVDNEKKNKKKDISRKIIRNYIKNKLQISLMKKIFFGKIKKKNYGGRN